MNEHVNRVDQGNITWQLKVGIGIFVLSIILPLGGIPLVTNLSLSTATTALISGALLVGSEVHGIVAIAIMGRDGYAFLKKHVSVFFRQYGPPQTVSRSRYTIGLTLYIIPIIFAWASIYLAKFIPYFQESPLPFALIGDGMLLASLFLLGGDFWDKIRSLFIYDAKAHFSQTSHSNL